jgi:hypothetical protein
MAAFRNKTALLTVLNAVLLERSINLSRHVPDVGCCNYIL